MFGLEPVGKGRYIGGESTPSTFATRNRRDMIRVVEAQATGGTGLPDT